MEAMGLEGQVSRLLDQARCSSDASAQQHWRSLKVATSSWTRDSGGSSNSHAPCGR